MTTTTSDAPSAHAAELRKIESRVREYEDVVRRTLAALRAINAGGMFDHLPLGDYEARNHNDAMHLLNLIEDELSRVDNGGDGQPSDMAGILANQLEHPRHG